MRWINQPDHPYIGRDVRLIGGDDAGDIRTIRGVQVPSESWQNTSYDVSPWGSPAGSHRVSDRRFQLLDEYVPTTEEIETTWVAAGLKPEYFDRWLKAERKRLWNESHDHCTSTGCPNPYEVES